MDALLINNNFNVELVEEELQDKTEDQQLYYVYRKIREYGLSFSEKEVIGFIRVYIANVIAAMEYSVEDGSKIESPILLVKTEKNREELSPEQNRVFSIEGYGMGRFSYG